MFVPLNLICISLNRVGLFVIGIISVLDGLKLTSQVLAQLSILDKSELAY
jgi:hypothetical protein